MKSNKEKQIKRKINKQAKNNDAKLQDFFEIKEIADNHIKTTTGQELYYINITPKNITVMSDEDIINLERQLSYIVSSLPKSEMLCINSNQSYDNNIEYLKSLVAKEADEAVRAIDEKDINYISNIKLTMATSRKFYLILRLRSTDSLTDKNKIINNAQQICREHNFDVYLAEKSEIKKMLAIYLEQNLYNDNPPDYDGQQFGLSEEEADEYNLKKFVDLIAPSVMDFKHPTYYIIGNTYRSVYAIREYATSTSKLHLLSEIGETDGVTLHIYTRLLNGSEQSKVFEKAEKRNKSLFKSSKNINQETTSRENLNDMQKMAKKAHREKEKFLHCAVYIEMIANSLETLKELKTTVNQMLTEANIIPDKLKLQQRDGFAAVAPFGFNIFKSEFERVMPASSMANLFPFSYSGKTDKNGLYIGKDVHGTNMIVDFDARDSNKTNGHIGIYGNSGEGKSYLIKLLLCNFRQQRKKIYSLDVDNEYSVPTTNLGGTNIDMLQGKYYINLLEPKIIMFDDEENHSTTMISKHIAFVKAFFNVYEPELTVNQLKTLEIMLEKTYEKFGINQECDFSDFTSKDFPVLSDLYEVTEYEYKNYDNASNVLYSREDVRSLTLTLRSIAKGSDSIFFNGHTNIPNNNHINFVVKGILDLNENLKNAIYFNVFSFLQHKFFEEGNVVVGLDEIHEIIKSRIVVNYIRSFMKRGRKMNSDLIVSSQNLDDLMLPGIIEYTRPLFSIPTHLFLFYPGNVNVKLFKETTNVNDTEYNLFSTPKRGYCFYVCGSEKYYIQIIAPQHKSALFGNAGGR